MESAVAPAPAPAPAPTKAGRGAGGGKRPRRRAAKSEPMKMPPEWQEQQHAQFYEAGEDAAADTLTPTLPATTTGAASATGALDTVPPPPPPKDAAPLLPFARSSYLLSEGVGGGGSSSGSRPISSSPSIMELSALDTLGDAHDGDGDDVGDDAAARATPLPLPIPLHATATVTSGPSPTGSPASASGSRSNVLLRYIDRLRFRSPAGAGPGSGSGSGMGSGRSSPSLLFRGLVNMSGTAPPTSAGIAAADSPTELLHPAASAPDLMDLRGGASGASTGSSSSNAAAHASATPSAATAATGVAASVALADPVMTSPGGTATSSPARTPTAADAASARGFLPRMGFARRQQQAQGSGIGSSGGGVGSSGNGPLVPAPLVMTQSLPASSSLGSPRGSGSGPGGGYGAGAQLSPTSTPSMAAGPSSAPAPGSTQALPATHLALAAAAMAVVAIATAAANTPPPGASPAPSAGHARQPLSAASASRPESPSPRAGSHGTISPRMDTPTALAAAVATSGSPTPTAGAYGPSSHSGTSTPAPMLRLLARNFSGSLPAMMRAADDGGAGGGSPAGVMASTSSATAGAAAAAAAAAAAVAPPMLAPTSGGGGTHSVRRAKDMRGLSSSADHLVSPASRSAARASDDLAVASSARSGSNGVSPPRYGSVANVAERPTGSPGAVATPVSAGPAQATAANVAAMDAAPYETMQLKGGDDRAGQAPAHDLGTGASVPPAGTAGAAAGTRLSRLLSRWSSLGGKSSNRPRSTSVPDLNVDETGKRPNFATLLRGPSNSANHGGSSSNSSSSSAGAAATLGRPRRHRRTGSGAGLADDDPVLTASSSTLAPRLPDEDDDSDLEGLPTAAASASASASASGSMPVPVQARWLSAFGRNLNTFMGLPRSGSAQSLAGASSTGSTGGSSAYGYGGSSGGGGGGAGGAQAAAFPRVVSTPMLPLWKEVGPEDFRVLKLIGKGDVGRVYLVNRKGTKRIYAMKVLSKDEMLKRKKVWPLRVRVCVCEGYHALCQCACAMLCASGRVRFCMLNARATVSVNVCLCAPNQSWVGIGQTCADGAGDPGRRQPSIHCGPVLHVPVIRSSLLCDGLLRRRRILPHAAAAARAAPARAVRALLRGRGGSGPRVRTHAGLCLPRPQAGKYSPARQRPHYAH
jgi:hypothetical protein